MISEIPYDVTAVETLPFAIPLKVRDSLGTKLPLVSYNTKDFEFETASFKNPVAPLELPFTKVGIAKVIASFTVISVVVWTS